MKSYEIRVGDQDRHYSVMGWAATCDASNPTGSSLSCSASMPALFKCTWESTWEMAQVHGLLPPMWGRMEFQNPRSWSQPGSSLIIIVNCAVNEQMKDTFLSLFLSLSPPPTTSSLPCLSNKTNLFKRRSEHAVAEKMTM